MNTFADNPGGAVHLTLDAQGTPNKAGDTELVFQVTTRENHVLQPEVFGPRTWRHDLRVFHFSPAWSQTVTFYKETLQALCLPSMLWMLLLNGTFLGLYVYQASTFATILTSPPYAFRFDWLGWVQLVQVLDCVILVPLLGYGSDLLARRMSTWRSGVFQVYHILPFSAIQLNVSILTTHAPSPSTAS